jgi:hypothetical protein
MDIRAEIEKFSNENHKQILFWLLDRYHWDSEWKFVAGCTFEYGPLSYQSNRVWYPKEEGLILYKYFHEDKRI